MTIEEIEKQLETFEVIQKIRTPYKTAIDAVFEASQKQKTLILKKPDEEIR